MFGVNLEMIQGMAIGVEWFAREDVDDFGYVVFELVFLRIVVSY
jgi:hypothetical protein